MAKTPIMKSELAKNQLESTEDPHRRGLLWAPWRMLEADHEEAETKLVALRKNFEAFGQGDRSVGVRWGIEQSLVYLNTDLVAHMEKEEKIIFPYLRGFLADIVPHLEMLLQEHAYFRAQLARVGKLHSDLAEDPFCPDKRSRLAAMGCELVDRLLNHVRVEIALMDQLTSQL